MQDKQDKKKKTNIKLNDLKPKKDAKGGVAANVSTNVSTSRSIQSRQHNQANHHYGQREKSRTVGSIPRAVLLCLFSTLNKGESHEPEGRRFLPPIVVFPPSARETTDCRLHNRRNRKR